VVRSMGRWPEKQELDRPTKRQELESSLDKIAATLGEALKIRDQVRAGQVGVAQAQTELLGMSQDLGAIARGLAQVSPGPTLLQSYGRVSSFAGNAAKQVGALASNAPPDSLDRTEARLHAMLTAAGRLRASIGPRPGNPS
ncbi:MAG TPA: hypothetical protein VJX91_07420, partial [Candidatus Eisenbacteria bacterium]|nr:hypothetical protein [Candidatus Eisenbacteria bacterium]